LFEFSYYYYDNVYHKYDIKTYVLEEAKAEKLDFPIKDQQETRPYRNHIYFVIYSSNIRPQSHTFRKTPRLDVGFAIFAGRQAVHPLVGLFGHATDESQLLLYLLDAFLIGIHTIPGL